MRDTNTGAPSPPTFEELAQAEHDRKEAAAIAIVEGLKKGELPTPEPIVRAIIWRIDRHVLMREHVYWKEHKLRVGLDALISAALAAHLDLARAEAALTAFAQTKDSFEDHIRQTVENPAQKEVMAFCAAYVGTVDTLRRFKTRRPDIWNEIDTLRIKGTGSVEYRFIFELRRNLSHGSVVVPYWNIRNDGAGTSGAIHFSSSELLAFGDWGSEVKGFLRTNASDSFSISAITAKCVEGLAKFRRDLEILFARHRTTAERDFEGINSLARRIGSRQFAKIVLTPLIAKGIDPYAHLHRFFSSEQVARILDYPNRSAEQIEYGLRLREAEMDIDDSLKSLIYDLFQAKKDFAVAPEPPSLEPKSLGQAWPPPDLIGPHEIGEGKSE